MKLNKAQNEAIRYISGPCLVLAGAGSGKTRVIINKIAYLIKECSYKANNIFAVTFTNKAAREMKERLTSSLSKKDTRGLWISTFHTLGLSIIKKEYKTLGLKSGFSLFDPSDSQSLLAEISFKTLEGDKDALKLLANKISNWKNDLITPSQALKLDKGHDAVMYKEYTEHMRAYNVLDFDDLILLPSLLLQHNENIREYWQNKIRYLLVDEYQDTNTSQYMLIKLLVGGERKFTVVGDDDQSIYSWRGARPQNLILLQQDFPSLKLIKLEENYRSTQRILKNANVLIANNDHVYDKKLYSQLGTGEQLKVISCENEDRESERVIAEIIKHHYINKSSYSDYAILYRSNHQSRILEKVLVGNNIPYKINGGTSFFAKAEIKDIMAYLRLIVNQNDDSAFLRIVNLPKRGIGTTSIKHLGELAKTLQLSLFTSIFAPELKEYVTGSAYSALQSFGRFIVEANDSVTRSEPLGVIRDMIKQINYEEYLYEYSSSGKSAEMRMKNVSELYRFLTKMLEGDELEASISLLEAVNRLTLRDLLERNNEDVESNQVQLMTLHASKGLEFKYVFMIGVEEGVLPHQTSIDDNNVEEERRLAYVGLTRAQQELTFTYCVQRRQFGELKTCSPSRFLLELIQEDLKWELKKLKSKDEQMQSTKEHIANLRKILSS